jgi:hypothetical protein
MASVKMKSFDQARPEVGQTRLRDVLEMRWPTLSKQSLFSCGKYHIIGLRVFKID